MLCLYDTMQNLHYVGRIDVSFFRDLDRSGADTIELATSDDWLGAIIAHVQNRRLQAVRGGALGRP